MCVSAAHDPCIRSYVWRKRPDHRGDANACAISSAAAPCRSLQEARTAATELRSLPLSPEAVAQSPTELTEAVLRVGWKIARLVTRTNGDRAGIGTLNALHVRHSAPGLRFAGRLCATASPDSARPNESGTRARSDEAQASRRLATGRLLSARSERAPSWLGKPASRRLQVRLGPTQDGPHDGGPSIVATRLPRSSERSWRPGPWALARRRRTPSRPRRAT